MSASGGAARLAAVATGERVESTHPLAGGYANDLYAVALSGGRRVVVRLYRRRPEVAAVEAAVMARAANHVPVPQVLLADAAGDTVGRPALVLSHVDGVLASEVLVDADAATSLELGRLLGATVAPLGRVTFSRGGFFTGPELDPVPLSGSLDVTRWVDNTLASPGAGDLVPGLVAAWRDLVAERAGAMASLDDGATLVHADFNPKNVLLRREADAWEVAAVLDWEFAFAGSPLVDLGNLQRFAHHQSPGYATAVGRGFVEAGGSLPENWRELAALLDVFALCDFLRRDPEAAYYTETVEIIGLAVARGNLVLTDA